MILEPIVYEYRNEFIKDQFIKQNEYENKNNRFYMRDTFEIYNCNMNIWEVFNPFLINYTFNNLKEKYIKSSVYYIIKYNRAPIIKDISYLPPLLGLNNIINKYIKTIDKYDYKNNYKYNQYETDYDNCRDIINSYLKNGNYYTTSINEYVDTNNRIRIRPIKNTSGYVFGYNPLFIKNNYWVKNKNIEVVEELNV